MTYIIYGKDNKYGYIYNICKPKGWCWQEKRVLVIDLDQQCNLTKNAETGSDYLTIYDLFKDEAPNIDEAIQHISAGYDIIAGSPALSKADSEFADTPDAYLLSDLLEALDEDYDYILIDSAPARNKLLNMCYLASDYFIMCADSGEDSLDGIEAIVNDMMEYHKKGKECCRIPRYLEQ